MAQSIDVGFKKPITSAGLNQKTNEILGANGVLRGYNVVASSGTTLDIVMSPDSLSNLSINGATISDTSSVIASLTIPPNTSGAVKSGVIYMSYNHGTDISGTIFLLLNTLSVPDAITCCKLAEITIPDGFTSSSQVTIVNMQKQQTMKDLQANATAHANNADIHISTKGDLTEDTSSVMTITGGTGAVISSGVKIQIKKATALQSGYVSNADWATFNAKQANLGYTPINKAGDSMLGALTLPSDPTQDLHAATKKYVDAMKQGLGTKDAVKVASTGNLTLSGLQTVDTIVLAVNDRILVKDQTIPSQNGVYTAQSTAWVRSIDFDQDPEVVAGAYIFVTSGTTNGNNGYTLITPNPIVVGTTGLSFTQFSGAGQITPGVGLSKAGNTLSLANTGTAGTYKSVTTDAQGRVTGGTNPTTLAAFGILDAVLASDFVAQLSNIRFFFTTTNIANPAASNLINNDVWLDGFNTVVKFRPANTATWICFGYTYAS